MKVLITGAGGFIGQALATALLADPHVSQLILTDIFEPPSAAGETESNAVTHCVKADLTSQETCEALFTADLDVVYLLHGLMSGAAEANLDLGLKVNIDATRQILDILRARNPKVKVVFTSSTAVYGPSQGTKFSEATAPLPQSSYGAEKLISEILLNDFSRRNLLDGRIIRLPTVIVRPGAPTGAASSFCSGIIREPLNGKKSELPVSRDVKVWVCSARTIIKNLLLAKEIPVEKYAGGSRVVNLPGITVSVEDMLQALKQVSCEDTLKLIEEKKDDTTERIVVSWPTHFDTSKATQLGFLNDGSLIQALKDYIQDHTNMTI